MSEPQTTEKSSENQSGPIELSTLFATKKGMTTYYDEKGDAISATVLKYDSLVVSQVKTKSKEGYDCVQVAFQPRSDKRTPKSQKNHLKAAGFENGAYFVREIREKLPEGVTVGSRVALSSLKVGDKVKVTGTSKGRGFAGVVKRFGNAGGPATHGSGFHRIPGSSGNRTWPARVMPGKKFPGHLGDETVTVKNLRIVDVIESEGVIVVSGAIPGANNSVIKLTKV